MREDSTIRCNNPRTFAQLQEEQGEFFPSRECSKAPVWPVKVFILQEPAWLERMNRLYTDRYLEKMKAYLLVSDVLQFMDLLDRDCYDRMMQVRNVCPAPPARSTTARGRLRRCHQRPRDGAGRSLRGDLHHRKDQG